MFASTAMDVLALLGSYAPPRAAPVWGHHHTHRLSMYPTVSRRRASARSDLQPPGRRSQRTCSHGSRLDWGGAEGGHRGPPVTWRVPPPSSPPLPLAQPLEQRGERQGSYRLHRTRPAALRAEAAEAGILSGTQGRCEAGLAHDLRALQWLLHHGCPPGGDALRAGYRLCGPAPPPSVGSPPVFPAVASCRMASRSSVPVAPQPLAPGGMAGRKCS
jgi:hypothetical protein